MRIQINNVGQEIMYQRNASFYYFIRDHKIIFCLNNTLITYNKSQEKYNFAQDPYNITTVTVWL